MWGDHKLIAPHVSSPMVVASVLALLLAVTSISSDAQSLDFSHIAKQAEQARTADRANSAIALYQLGIAVNPAWAEGWWWLGSLLYDQDRFPEAETAFRHFVAIASKPGPGYAFLGLCEYETGAYDKALADLREWARSGWPGNPELIDVATFHLALLLTKNGRFVESLYLLATEAGKGKDSPALAEAMGLASLRIANLPEGYPPERREMVWIAGKAALYQSLPSPDFLRSNEYAERLLLHYDGEPNVHYFRGTLFQFEGKQEVAKAEFERELSISPQHVPAMIELAKQDLAANRLDAALNLARRAVEIEPKNPEAHHLLGRALLAQEQFQAAAHELETAKVLAPDSPTIRSHLATAYQQLGYKKEAERELAVFLRLKNEEDVLAPPNVKLKPDQPRPSQ
jgi:tetratricopeptide (TPR) repeat protein